MTKKRATHPTDHPKRKDTVLVMRTCAAHMSSRNGFVWPEKGPVECDDWSPVKLCGNGLHGLLWGCGDGYLLDWSEGAKWLVVEVAADDVIDLDGKVKFPRGVVIFCGDRKGATECIYARRPNCPGVVGGTATAGARGTATAGDAGTATAGDAGILIVTHLDGCRYRRLVGKIGKGGLEPGVPYMVREGKFVRADAVTP